MENLEIWKSLEKTDPKYTKQFKRSGGFSGTAQNPTYAIKKMTDVFGPAGIGWGIEKPEFTFVNAQEGEVLVYCTISLWYVSGGVKAYTWGVGGDTAVSKNKYGLNADDEACKKATTDAMTNAMKTIGMAADLHLGMFDDSKYVNAVNTEMRDREKSTPAIVMGGDDVPPETWLSAKITRLEEFVTKPKSTIEKLIEGDTKTRKDPIFLKLNDPQRLEYEEAVKSAEFALKARYATA